MTRSRNWCGLHRTMPDRDRRHPRLRPAEGESNAGDARQAWHARLGESHARLLDEDAALYLHQALSTPCLAAVRRAEGVWIEDVEGRRYIDFHGNNVHHVGYGHPRLREALRSQLEELAFSPRRFTNEVAVRAAHTLAQVTPGGLKRVLFAPGGSEAMDMAITLARLATGRFKTLSFWDAFHGAGLGPASVGGEQMFRSHGIGPLLAGTEHVAPFHCHRCPYGHPAPDGVPDLDRCRLACASQVRYVLEREGDVAAVIAEPMRAVPVIPPPGYWREVRRACDDHGALLIFDEIPMGLGKTGRMFACDHEGVVPDMLVLGKALGGAMLPVAALVTREDLNVAGDRAIGHFTHEKNPLLLRAVLATLEIIESEQLVQNAREVGAHALGRLRGLRDTHEIVGHVAGRGLALGVEVVAGRGSVAPAPVLAERVLYTALARGLSFKVSMGNVLSLSAPLIVSRQEMDAALDILEAAIAEVAGGH